MGKSVPWFYKNAKIDVLIGIKRLHLKIKKIRYLQKLN